MCDSWIVVSCFVVGFVSEAESAETRDVDTTPLLPFLTDRRKTQEKWCCGGGDGT